MIRLLGSVLLVAVAASAQSAQEAALKAGRLERFGTPQRGHYWSVTGIEFRPDGRQFLSSSHDGTVKLWHAKTAKHHRTLRVSEAGVWRAFYYDDGKKIVTVSMDCAVRFFDATSGKQLGETAGLAERFADPLMVRLQGEVTPDGTQLWFRDAVQPQHALIRVDLVARKLLDPLVLAEKHLIRDFAFSPDGKSIAAVFMDEQWEGAFGVYGLDGTERHRGTCPVMGAVRFTTDGAHFVTASGTGVEYRKVEDGTLAHQYEYPESRRGVTGFAITPDGSRAYAGFMFEGTVTDIGVTTSEIGFEFSEFLDTVNSIALSPDGTRLVCGSSDGSIRVLDAKSGQEQLLPKGHQNRVEAVAIADGGSHIVSGTFDNEVVIWDAKTRKVTHEMQAHEYSVLGAAFTADGKALTASYDSTIKLYDVATGSVQRTITIDDTTAAFSAFAFSKPSSLAITGHQDGSAHVWDVEKGESIQHLASTKPGYVSAVAITDQRFAIGNRGDILVYDHGRNRPVFSMSPPRDEDGWVDEAAVEVTAIAFLPAGRLATGHGDGHVRIYEIETSALLHDIELRQGGGSVTDLCVSPGGEVLFASIPSGIRSLSTSDWKPTRNPFEEFDGGVMAIDVDSNGATLVAAMTDGTLLRLKLTKWK